MCRYASVCHYVWIIWLPRLGGLAILEEVQNLPDGARVTCLRKKYLVEATKTMSPVPDEANRFGMPREICYKR